MSKLSFGGFAGPGRHRLHVRHDGPWEHMRILFKRPADSTPTAAAEPRSTEHDVSQAS